MVTIIGLTVCMSLLCAIGERKIEAGFVGAVAGCIVGFVVALIVGVFAYDNHEIIESSANLENLADGGSRMHGSFFLGSGTINDVSVFTWYEANGDNSYVQRRADADLSTVHYLDTNLKPYYRLVIEQVEDGPFFETWGLRADSGLEIARAYHFYVPRGSIKHNYELDAQ